MPHIRVVEFPTSSILQQFNAKPYNNNNNSSSGGSQITLAKQHTLRDLLKQVFWIIREIISIGVAIVSSLSLFYFILSLFVFVPTSPRRKLCVGVYEWATGTDVRGRVESGECACACWLSVCSHSFDWRRPHRTFLFEKLYLKQAKLLFATSTSMTTKPVDDCSRALSGNSELFLIIISKLFNSIELYLCRTGEEEEW